MGFSRDSWQVSDMSGHTAGERAYPLVTGQELRG